MACSIGPALADGNASDRGSGLPGECRAQYNPFTARLFASVPPLVKTTSLGRAPKACAICSRDSSTTRRARRPALCSDDGFPVWASSCAIAASASGSIGVVAA